MKKFLAIVILTSPLIGFGITSEVSTLSNPISNAEEPRTTGYIDANGKQGFFIIYGRDMPEKAGYPAAGKIEEGNFKDDRKTGEWIVYHTDGETPRLKGNFVDGRPNGPYTKFNNKGVIIEKSSFNNNKQAGDYEQFDADGNISQRKTFNAEGKEHGTSTFYYPNGQVQYVVNKVNGLATGEATRYWDDGSVKEVVTFSASGEVFSTKIINAEPPVVAKTTVGNGGPSGVNGVLKDGSAFKSDGYNKVYNKAQDLWLDGQFKSNKLWDGKLYKYDSDGILLKIEIWKNGAYHSDGQLN